MIRASTPRAKSTMARCTGILLDLDGVIYVGGRVLPGSLEAVARLREAGIPVRFLTNTTRTPHRLLLAKLRVMGLDVAGRELFTPAMAARALLEREGLRPLLLVHPALEEDFAGLAGSGAEAVVLGDAGDAFSYAAMNAAFRALGRGAEFLALANNRCFRDDDGGLSLDAGPFVAALSFASRREPLVLGKPAAAFFHAALASMGVKPEDAAMVGDDVESDVGGAMAAGLSGILVRTGKYEAGAEAHISPPPSAVVDDLAAAVEWLLAGA
jgi:HAD superfamily hydrolase (TIGR01458 family)